MKKLLLILPLVVLAVLAWWLFGEPTAVERVARTAVERAETAAETSARLASAASVVDGERAEVAEREPAVDRESPDPPPQSDLLVIVADARGRRLEGAQVGWELDGAEGSSATDSEGVARLALALPVRRLNLRAEHEGYATTRASASGNGPITLRLDPLTSLAGRVLESDSLAPLSGVLLIVSHGLCDGCARDQATSGFDGRYEFPEIPADANLRIRASGPDVAGQWVPLRLALEEGPHLHDFVLERGVLVRGLALDLVTREPLRGVGVEPATRGIGGVETDTEGRFELRVLDAGDGIVLLASVEGFCTLRANLTESETDLRELVELTLARCATIEGVVRDASGQPVPAAIVHPSPNGSGLEGIGYVGEEPEAAPRNAASLRTPLDDLPTGWQVVGDRWKQAVADDRGRYALSALIPWRSYASLQARAHGFEVATLTIDSTLPAGGTARHDLVLTRAEAAGIAVVVGDLTVNGHATHGRVFWRQGSKSGSAMVIHNPYRLVELRPGPAELWAQPLALHVGAPKIPGLEGYARTVEVPREGEMRVDFDMRFEPSSIRGRVVDELGDGVASVYVHARLEKFEVARSAPTDEAGRFELTVPAEAGPFTVVGPGNNNHVEGVAAGRQDVTIVVPRTGRLLVRARDAVSGARLVPSVSWRNDPTHALRRAWRMDSPDPLGWRGIDLPAGDAEVTLSDANHEYVQVQTTVRISPDAPTRLDIDLERGLSATIEFDPPLPDDFEAYLVPSAVIARAGPLPAFDAFSRSGEYDRRLNLPAGARAELRGLTPGTYHLVAWADDVPLDIVWIPGVFELPAESSEHPAESAEHTVRWTRRR